MYDWIPIEFDYDILVQLGDTKYERYHCIANGEDRESFTVFKNNHVVLSTYYIDSLIDSMETGCRINGMTMDELKDSYYSGNEEFTIDISALI